MALLAFKRVRISKKARGTGGETRDTVRLQEIPDFADTAFPRRRTAADCAIFVTIRACKRGSGVRPIRTCGIAIARADQIDAWSTINALSIERTVTISAIIVTS